MEDQWQRSAGGWFKYSPNYPAGLDAAIGVYHPKKEQVLFPDAESIEIYVSGNIYSWRVEFYDHVSFLQEIHNRLYGSEVTGSEDEVKVHIDNFLNRISGLAAFT